jgi:hypothetical protein
MKRLQPTANSLQLPTRGRRRSIVGRWLTAVGCLLCDEAAVTSLEYIVAALAIALGAIAASRVMAGALVGYLHRIYVVVTLPVP